MEYNSQELIQKATDFAVLYGVRIVAAAIIFIIGKWLAKIASNWAQKILIAAKCDETLASFIKNLAYAFLLVFVVIAALNKLGVNTTSAVAIIGAAGLAVGLALQGSLSNFAAGVMIIIFKPFQKGDVIDAAGVIAKVEDIGIFCSTLRTGDNLKVIVPNAQITGGNITNYTALSHRRIDMVFGISYDDDIKKAKEVLTKVVTEHPKVLKDPAPVIAVSELGDSSVNLICRPFVLPADYWAVRFDIIEQGKVELEKAGLTIPFPQRDVHLYNESK